MLIQLAEEVVQKKDRVELDAVIRRYWYPRELWRATRHAEKRTERALQILGLRPSLASQRNAVHTSRALLHSPHRKFLHLGARDFPL